MNRWPALWLGVLICVTAHAEVVPGARDGYVSVHTSGARVSDVLSDFAEVVGISISFRESDLPQDSHEVMIDNIPWRDCLVLLTERYNLEVHQVHEGEDLVFSSGVSLAKMTKDKPFYLLPAKMIIPVHQYDKPLDVIRAVREDMGAWSPTKIASLMVLLLCLLAIAYHWGARALRVSTSFMSKGILAAAMSVVVGIALSVLPLSAACAIGIPMCIILVKAVFQTSIPRSISIMLLAGVFFSAFAAISTWTVFWVGIRTVPY